MEGFWILNLVFFQNLKTQFFKIPSYLVFRSVLNEPSELHAQLRHAHHHLHREASQYIVEQLVALVLHTTTIDLLDAASTTASSQLSCLQLSSSSAGS